MKVHSQKNLILGAIYNLSIEALNPFFHSLRKTGFDDEIVVFYAKTSPEILQSLRQFGITLIPFHYHAIRNHQPALLAWPLWRFLISQCGSFAAKARIAEKVWCLVSLRFLLYYKFLSKRIDQYRYVLLTDMRDVVFQGDPFSGLQGSGVWAFEENGPKAIEKCPRNISMVHEAVGSINYERIKSRPISCAGVTLGSSPEILEYLRSLCEASFAAARLHTCSGADQGMHNWIIHSKLLPFMHLLNNQDSATYTMGDVKRSDYSVINNRVVRNNQTVPSILHQYDRHEELRQLFGVPGVSRSPGA